MRAGVLVSQALLDAWAVLAPTQCSGCGAADRAVCVDCRAALQPAVHRTRRGNLVCWAALEYSGPARRVIAAYKDGDRTDAARALSAPFGSAIRAALADVEASRPTGAGVHLVTVPSTRLANRTRGYSPVGLLLRRTGLRATAVLELVVAGRDQAGLGREERIANRRGSLAARVPLHGFRCLLVDDILTTGATLIEARRAVVAAGGEVVGVAVLAETPRLSSGAHPSQQTLRQNL